MNLELSKEDVEYLILLLGREHKSALVEQHHTDDRAFRQLIKTRIEKIEELLSKLEKAAS